MTKKAQQWEVQTLRPSGWENCWLAFAEENPYGKPKTFTSRRQAEKELEEYLQALQDQFNGDAGTQGLIYQRTDYRIVPVGTKG